MSLRVGFYRNAPEMYDNCYRTPQLDRLIGCPYPGWCVEIIQYISNQLNYTIQPILNQEKVGSIDWGTMLDNGTWTGALGSIERGLVDTVCLMYQATNLRSQHFDFSTSVVSAKPVFVVRQPEENFNDYMWKVFRTFETQLWFLFAFVVAVQCGVMIICYWLESEVMGIQNRFKPLRSAWQIFRFFIVQPHGRYRRWTYGGNILMCVCAFATLLFTSLYQGLLLTRLLDPLDTVPFTTSDQMVKMLAEKKFFDELQHSNWSYFVRMREAVKSNPIKFVDTVEEALDEVENGNYIYPTQEDSYTMFEAQKRCSLVYMDNAIPSLFVSFAFKKGSRIIDAWNRAMINTQTFQIKTFDKYMRDHGYLANPRRCTEKSEKQKKMGQSLPASDLTGAFLLMIIGTVSAFLVLLSEYYVKKMKKE